MGLPRYPYAQESQDPRHQIPLTFTQKSTIMLPSTLRLRIATSSLAALLGIAVFTGCTSGQVASSNNEATSASAQSTQSGTASASETTSADAANTADTQASTESTTIIDVRTPEEYAQGHLEGAINIDLSSPSFADTIAQLDTAGSYVVYCRSGNRSGQALTLMTNAGFVDVTNAGGLQEAAETLGLPIVSGN
ncbi:rhodanese-like domain-containing protein [Schaalia suimastitidis]|uniref:rhodanese-like domain-containing protein n=1 Tax=Schaalia suimastitidis TaxID=121163 RepID=UPI00041FE503|nr:rhodanese-like domain-containing protein [Schaalia suimastitidis]